MDIYDRVAARATVYLMENPEVSRCISWATTAYQYVALAVQKVDFPFGNEIDILPDPGREALDNVRETLEIFDGPTGPGSEQETSVEIGGPKVEAEIAEIRKLQDEQEKVRADQAAQVAEFRDQLAKKYEDSPEQEKHLKEFDNAAKVADDTLVRQQAAELQKLQEQQLQRSNPTDPSRDR